MSTPNQETTRAATDVAEFTGADFSRRTDVVALMAEVEALRKDAERYRWLRNHAPGESHFFHDGSKSNYVELNVMFTGSELPDLNEAIDAAIADMPAVGAA